MSGRKKRTRRRKTKAVVVGGGRGWARELCGALIDKGLEVVVVDEPELLGEREGWKMVEAGDGLGVPAGVGDFEYLFFLGLVGRRRAGGDELLAGSVGLRNWLEEAKRRGAKVLLVSDLSVFRGEVATGQIGGAGEAREGGDGAGEAKRFAERLVSDFTGGEKLNARIVRVGMVYGEGEGDFPLGYLVEQIRTGGEIDLGRLPEKLYPVWVEDVVMGVLTAMFGVGTRGTVVTLAGEARSVEDVVGWLEERLERKARTKGEVERGREIPEEALETGRELIGWREKVEWEKGRELMWERMGGEEKMEDGEKGTERRGGEIIGLSVGNQESKEKKRGSGLFKFKGGDDGGESRRSGSESQDQRAKDGREKRGKGSKWVGWGLGGCLLALVVYLWILPLGALMWGGWWSFRAAAVLETNPTGAGVKAKRAERSFRLAGQKAERLVDWPGAGEVAWWYKETADLGRRLASGLGAASEVVLGTEEMAREISGRKDRGEVRKNWGEVEVSLGQLGEDLAFWESAVKQGLPWPLSWWVDGKEVGEKLPTIRRYVSWGKQILPYWGKLVGGEGRVTYLVLLQNNMELRPTGGFIGSFALVTWEKGELIDFQVQDVYSADGQLKGHVEPPGPLREHLGEASWYLRDSNWDPDFPTSAVRAEWFLQKELGRQVDGVVAVNLDWVKRLLEVTGPVELPDYEETITAENLFERAEYRAEANFFPGSKQKRDFLATLAGKLKLKIAEGEVDGGRLMLVLGEGLMNKEVMVYWNDEELGKMAFNLGWDGALREPKCEKGWICDGLFVVEANVGVNKVNYFVRQKAEYEVGLEGGTMVKGKLRLTYENTAVAETWPAGRYKNYVRIYAPSGAELDRVVVRDEKGEEVRFSEEQIEREVKGSWGVWGFLVEIPVKGKREVAIEYKMGEAEEMDGRVGYRLVWMKQPGKHWEEVKVRVRYNPDWQVLATEPAALTGNGELVYNVGLSADSVVAASFKL